ncbi:MAG TPA: nucleotidyltransferase domain-containing protein [Micromonosporaceae bacterium]|nr:nucleotidyltransferase domain-containing protein [Micromonosporaceae bacterium]
MIPPDLPDRLVAVQGVVAIALVGSRARGTHRPDSDWDLGLYYRGDLDVDGLRALAASVVDAEPPGSGPHASPYAPSGRSARRVPGRTRCSPPSPRHGVSWPT